MSKRKNIIKSILNGELKLLPVYTKTPFGDEKKIYKIYNDGGHFVATRIYRKSNQSAHKKKTNELDGLFDALYFVCIKSNLQPKQYFNAIKTEMIENYCVEDNAELDEYITKKIKQKLHNLYKRKKLFKRKANLNKWNYFVTFTFDDKKHTAESFRRKLRKCLSNLHTRRNWRYMGVFELGEDNKRLHFHALMYIPDGEMVGNITKLEEYSTRLHSMKTRYANDFFDDTFGRSDFVPIKQTEMTINYILKYLGKTDERIVYSRGIADYIVKELEDYEIATEFIDYVYKYVLFDDTIDWENDVMHFKFKLSCMFDCM